MSIHVVEAEEMHKVEDALLAVCHEHGSGLPCVSASIGLLGAMAGMMFKRDAESAWRNIWENESLRALFVDRFNAMRACMAEDGALDPDGGPKWS